MGWPKTNLEAAITSWAIKPKSSMFSSTLAKLDLAKLDPLASLTNGISFIDFGQVVRGEMAGDLAAAAPTVFRRFLQPFFGEQG